MNYLKVLYGAKIAGKDGSLDQYSLNQLIGIEE